MAVFIDFCLDHVAFSTKDVQGPVNIMKFIGRAFQKLRGNFIGRALAAWLQDPCIDQVGKDRIDVVFKHIFLFQFPADLIHLHLVINGLQEKVAAAVKGLSAIIQLPVCMEGKFDLLFFLFLFIF